MRKLPVRQTQLAREPDRQTPNWLYCVSAEDISDLGFRNYEGSRLKLQAAILSDKSDLTLELVRRVRLGKAMRDAKTHMTALSEP